MIKKWADAEPEEGRDAKIRWAVQQQHIDPWQIRFTAGFSLSYDVIEQVTASST
ncbi:hypothetical protein GCM10010245_91790 [Streptomyces spectabilis]|uniref:Uncharacterized protein n=1 Tax=Streptomyces spectabilis TaxID=68270 RepID=A0A7W8EZP0_STRST|nr:hypothetical protein [Streptomyces spectabilis]MBB5110111.1 hypothetical protein [Streptomyces spectabilis]GGV58660.1 hypothetical protein GCM10010245_91790 [Streptomyces spectabilis]